MRAIENIDLARAALPGNCPACGALALMTIESRVNGSARRRRKQCSRCGDRSTTYEISQEEYFKLTNRNARGQRRLKLVTAETPRISCISCIHWKTTSCGLDFPEAGGFFATECSCFSAK